MPSNENTTSQIKSRQQVANCGKHGITNALLYEQGQILYKRHRQGWDSKGRCVCCVTNKDMLFHTDIRETFTPPPHPHTHQKSIPQRLDVIR